MTAAAEVFGLGVTEILVIAGICGYLIDRFADAKGWSRSSRTLRRENEDLVRRNGELEQTIQRLEKTIIALEATSAEHERQIAEMKLRDVTALFELMVGHERNAATRAEETQEILGEIRDSLKKGAL